VFDSISLVRGSALYGYCKKQFCNATRKNQKIFVQIQNKLLVQMLNCAVAGCQLIVNLRLWSETPSSLFLTNAFFLQNSFSYSLKQIIGDHNI
jgi:hypothetical protein